jgi:hypothetical protein
MIKLLSHSGAENEGGEGSIDRENLESSGDPAQG